MAESDGPGVSVDQLLGFMDGSRLDELRVIDGEVRATLEETLALARTIAGESDDRLRAMLEEMLSADPGLPERPAVIQIIEDAKPSHRHMPLLDACIDADVPAFLHGEAGSGKSTAAERVASIRGLAMRAISLAPTTSKADLLGFRDATGNYNDTGFREIYEHGGIFLFDEIDNGNPSIMALMNRALANFESEFPDGPVERDWNTRIIAAANTIGRGATAQYVGRNALDAATLDRFALIPWDIDERLERQLLKLEVEDDESPVKLDKGGVPTTEEWLDEVRGFRSRAAESGLRVVISPRSAIYGKKLAEQGVGIKWLKELLIFKGISETDREKLEPRRV